MPFTAYTEDDLRAQFYEARDRQTKECIGEISKLENPVYLREMLDAYHVEQTTNVIALIKGVIEDAKTRVNKSTGVPFEIYDLDMDVIHDEVDQN